MQPELGWPIRRVVEDTGVSKELIHHYLRQGVLPKSESKARYTPQQVSLLSLIRSLREEHSVPLDVIRQVFERFGFDPARLAILALAESPSKRMSRLVSEGEVVAQRLSIKDLLELAQISAERLEDYKRAKLVVPEGEAEHQRYSGYDANIIGLCESGLRLGVPFESFTTIASYVRVAFELEHEFFLGMPEDTSPEEQISELFLRRELATSFVQNVLHARVLNLIERTIQHGPPRSLSTADLLFRPSRAFLERHGIDQELIEMREKLSRSLQKPGLWLELSRALIHAGQEHEAAFLLEQGLSRWPDHRALRAELARALLISGEAERASSITDDEVRAADPRIRTLEALLLLKRILEDDRPEAMFSKTAGSIVREVERAMDDAAGARAEIRIETEMLGGWLLTALPDVGGRLEEGFARMRSALDESGRLEPNAAQPLRGLREKLRIQGAHLLLNASKRSPARAGSTEGLADQICRLDPASEFATRAFLNTAPAQGAGGGTSHE